MTRRINGRPQPLPVDRTDARRRGKAGGPGPRLTKTLTTHSACVKLQKLQNICVTVQYTVLHGMRAVQIWVPLRSCTVQRRDSSTIAIGTAAASSSSSNGVRSKDPGGDPRINNPRRSDTVPTSRDTIDDMT